MSEGAGSSTDAGGIAVPSAPVEVEPFAPRLPLRGPAERVYRVRPAYRVVNRVEREAFLRRVPKQVSDHQGVALQRRGGRLRLVQVRPDVTGWDAALSNRDLVVGLCDTAGIPMFLVPEPGARRFRIGIRDEHWPAFLDALFAAGEQQPIYIGVEARTRTGGKRRWAELSADRRIARAAREQPELEVFTILAASESAQLFDRPWACIAERWIRDDAGGLVAPSRNERTTYLAPAFQELTDEPDVAVDAAGARAGSDAIRPSAPVRRLPVPVPFTDRHIFDVDFPIDLVYMWVDGGDPAWQERKARVLAELGHTQVGEANAEARFRDAGELKYSLRSVERYAPWVRRIYLVTDEQVPAWLRTDHPRLQVVDHKELFEGVGRLPSFNSHAIGARLHHIDGLSEQYIHFNDDFFLGRDVQPGRFFHSNGVSKFFLSRTTLGFADPADEKPHDGARRNVVNLLRQDFGRSPTRAFFHTPITQRRSIMYELEERYPEQFASTWASQLRSTSDYEINSWLHHYYGYLVGKAEPSTISYAYFGLSDPTAELRMERMLIERNAETFCINDDPDTTVEQHRASAKWLAQYYPKPCSFEKA